MHKIVDINNKQTFVKYMAQTMLVALLAVLCHPISTQKKQARFSSPHAQGRSSAYSTAT